MSWVNFPATPAFPLLRATGSNPAVAALDLSQNALTGNLSASVSGLTNVANVGLAIYDNLIGGTIPSSFASFSWLALAYNPLLYGSLPSGMVNNTMNKLQVCGCLRQPVVSARCAHICVCRFVEPSYFCCAGVQPL